MREEFNMNIRIAINGFGRIGRNIVRAIYERNLQDKIDLVAINDLSPIECTKHLLKHDSVHGLFPHEVSIEGDDLLIDGKHIKMLSNRYATQLPWKDLNIDMVFECTGAFASKVKAQAHLDAGAKKVLISAPAGNDVKTVVFGVNQDTLTAEDQIVSNASCTTNCLAPLVSALLQSVGIERGLMTTVHAYTNDQGLTDAPHKDLRRARSATQSMIPTKTGAAAAVGLVLPEMAGKLDGYAVRVPTINVSMVDLTFEAPKAVSIEEVHAGIERCAEGNLKGILGVCKEPLVSIDFNHCPLSSVYDAGLTKVTGNLVKVIAWYDNEWGFSNRMLDTAMVMSAAS
jgi:glyceraldehyde 3-phosphate dehydrogenase